MIRWPGDLPQLPLRDSFSSRREDIRLSFQPQSGPPKRRRHTTAASDLQNMGFALTDAECAMLDRFYEEDLAEGTLPFLFEDPRRGDDARYTFETPISYEPYGRDWRASFTLRRMH